MDKIRFMVVSGFLGAGKTTTMIALAEHLNKSYGETAIIANDLGANLVDTNLTQTSGCTVAEIASGCICYQMDNTIDQIRRLRDKDGAVFVMSDIPGCGVGALDHVYHRLAEDCADEFTLSPFTVVVDPERLRMIMPERADINLPEELVYLLKLQLEEADLVVLNKADLLEEADIHRYVDFLKTACPDIPVIVISARGQESEKVAALDMGADDYVTKPFAVGELLARIRVALRKHAPRPEKDEIFVLDTLKVDFERRKVYVEGNEIHLTPIEYRLLTLLIRNRGKVLTHRFISKEIWGYEYTEDFQSLRVFMATLRKKIEPDPSQPKYIQTHVGVGYRMLRL